jgi:hypothetical protein
MSIASALRSSSLIMSHIGAGVMAR